MTGTSRLSLRRDVAALMAIVFLLAGGAIAYLLVRGSRPATAGVAGASGSTAARSAETAPVDPAPGVGSGEPLPDVTIPLSAEAADRAGIVVAPVESGRINTAMRLPGLVEPNAYRRVAVTPLVAGRVTRVAAELGDRVRRGQLLAQVYSPELAEAQTRYVSARAELDAHDRELQRTQKLVEIGAASRQELERVHAEHTAQTAAVQSARSRLELLGVPAATIDAMAPGRAIEATISVPAPIEGVVTEREANVGLNVEQADELFTVVDLSTVWVVADLYERDFSRVRVGSEATVTTTAYPELALRGRVEYIDPVVDAAARTAQVRVEIPNPGQQLRLGMYVDVSIAAASGPPVTVVPRSALQTIGDRQVVYLADAAAPGSFTQREVRLGASAGEQVEVVSGVRPGELVVTRGSFSVRAEGERLGLRARTGAPRADVQSATVIVGERGYEPPRLSLRAGAPARITFLRTTDATCGTEVVFPALGIKRALPLNEPVVVELDPLEAGEIAFICGMNMLRGTIVAQ